jgi:methionyl-tRNA formyltransferase
MLRIAFAGTPEFALPALRTLAAMPCQLIGVLTQPDRPAGRGRQLQASPVKRLALELGLPVAQPATLKAAAERAALLAWAPELLVVVAYGLILPPAVLELPRLGCLNIHASLLPRWRGAAPIQRAILAGDATTGITLMRMDAGLDTGPILRQQAVPIGAQTTGGELHGALASLGAGMLASAIEDLAAGRMQPQPQPAAGVTYAAKIDKAEARIDWKRPAREVLRHIHGLSPFPGAWCEIAADGEPARVKILRCEPAKGSGAHGEVLDDRLTIACGDGAIRILELQRAGKAPMKAADFLRGTPLKPGARFA